MFSVSSALLDGCVLAVLERGDTYGYSLTQEMKKALPLSESTLYPVLRRLQREGCLTVYDRPYQGRNRRYYAITTQGKTRLEEHRREWWGYRRRIDGLLFRKGEVMEA